MKKVWIILMTLAMVLATFAFVGCEEDKKPTDNGNIDAGNTDGGDTDEGETDNDTGVVTESEWLVAFSAESFQNYVFEGSTISEIAPETPSRIIAKIQTTEDAVYMYIKQSLGTDFTENYYEETESTVYEYAQKNGTWIRKENEYFTSSYMLTYSSMFADQFSKATFNAETKSYSLPSVTVGEGDTAQTYSDGVVKFADKKIAQLNYTVINNNPTFDYGLNVEIKFSQYGNVVVELPDDYEDETEGITEEEWKAAFDEKIFENISYTMENGNSENSYTIKVQRQTVNDVYLIRFENVDSQNSVDFYERHNNGATTYHYYASGDKWIKEKTDHYQSDISPDFVPSFINDYNNFTYDAERDIFRAEDLPSTYYEGYTYNSAEAKFSGTKLEYLKIEMMADENTLYFVEFHFSDQGTTVIEMPAEEDVIDRTQTAELTEEEWKTAFDESIFDNITYTQTITVGIQSQTVKYSIVRKDSVYLIAVGDNLRFEITDEGSYKYSLEEGTWKKQVYTSGFGYDFCYFMSLRDMYDFFREYFDGNQNGYIADNVEVFFGGTTPELCEQVSILLNENRKISEVTYVMSEGRGTISCKIEYGNAEVTLPEDFVDETAPAQGMTETEWNAAFDESNFYNMTYTSSRSDAGDGYESYAENTIRVYTAGQSTIIYTSAYLNGELSSETYYECTDDGVFFLYTFSDGVWTKTQQNGDPLKGLCGEITAFQSMYGKLEYDSADHTYKGDGITSTELAIENAAVTISFADGKIAGFSVDTKDETSTMQIRGSIEYESKEIVLPAIEEQ